MYESRAQAPLSRPSFAARLGRHLLAAVALLAASLAVGIWGYVEFEGLQLLDAFLNAAMLLGGMGPVNPPIKPAGKVFAGFYALYAGLAFVLTTALILTPVAHRLLHKFHWDTKL